ncbi:MAG: amino acid racemase [Candidatus Promineifilaceae bacterium]|nr:amino acid racemase [Candidatus Promineifilaceae bacterium]
MQTIGILGGIGPQATMDFVRRIHDVSQKHITPQDVRGYPPLIVHYCRFPPVLTDEEGRAQQPPQPDPRLLQAAADLGQRTDFLVVTANGPHQFADRIAEAAGTPLLSMIAVTLDRLHMLGWRRVGLIGLGLPHVYMDPLDRQALDTVALPDDLRQALDQAIIAVMEGRDGAAERDTARQALAWFADQDVDGVVLGCTEVPLLVDDVDRRPDLLNPAQLLAEAAVTRALV